MDGVACHGMRPTAAPRADRLKEKKKLFCFGQNGGKTKTQFAVR